MHLLPGITVIVPFIFAIFLLVFCRRNEAAMKVMALAGSALSFLASAAMLPALAGGQTLGTGMHYMSFPLAISFQADGISIFFAVIFSFCFMLAFIYSFGYLAHGHGKLRYYVLMLFSQGSILGVVMAYSLFGLFLFFELMAIISYGLVIHEEDDKAMYAGSKYLFMTIVAGLAIFFGLAVTYFLGGRLDFVAGGYIEASPLVGYALFAFLIGFGLKAGMFPLHIWLPDAHPAAPAAVSALLSGCMIKTGAYGFIRLIHYVFTVEAVQSIGFDTILLWLSIITILLGSALALQQDQLKRRLAYSSVAQIGYVLLGIAMLSEQALMGALFHIFSHALMKGALFLCAGAIMVQTGKKYISEMRGIGFEMPVTMLAFTLAAVTMVGIPPFNAFISKWHLAMASLDSGQTFLVAVLIVSSLLNALYYFPIVVNAFFARDVMEPGSKKRHWLRDEVPAGMVWSTALLAVLCVAFAFIQPHWPVVFAAKISAVIF
ncbi:complex I subunit 5 family protein [Dethiobacter alkaliphilus]|uniref:complex I subunit 5 family protein n=1 Tax=Dethiobacter alkaliphilus TaxID=427926 RepID=UPI002226307A|nr:proton-conducting transporter membrane subunit [Dethiobacter alkaliphilus]MCW3489179.1 proton-conducting transporter membrane subunit [Dethiobacter alkaliphilus]